MNKRKLQIWLPLLFSLTMIVGMFIGFNMRTILPGKSFFFLQKKNPLQEILNLIDKKYVDDVDVNKLTDTAILSILSKLDPHSSYIPAKNLQQINEEINGSFFGIGIEFNIFSDSLNVINVIPDGPSAKAGLQIGDIILKANDSVISGHKVSVERIRNILRGPFESEVNLQFLRNGKIINANLKRGIIPLSSIDASYMLDSLTGYIKINKFTSQTYREFMLALTDLKKKNMQQLVLDLRDNGGGVLEEAVEIADEFLSGEKLITYTEGKSYAKKEYRSRREGQFENGKLIVLANEGSASASEILIGALQDWDRATIIGRKTFGKGLVQEQFNLSNNAALRLTIARYYTPVGRSIQRPYTHGGKAYYDEISDRYQHGELTNADSVRNDTAQLYKTAAGKIIYGGGGITPEVFIAADTSRMGITTARLYASSIFNDFGYKYYIKHPGLKKQYPTTKSFVDNFSISDADWQFFANEAKSDSLNVSKVEPEEKQLIEKILKSVIARQLFSTEGYFEVVNHTDKSIAKALELLYKK